MTRWTVRGDETLRCAGSRFQAASALIAQRVSNLFSGDDEPPAAEIYIAEGTRDVRINCQPAARSAGYAVPARQSGGWFFENGVHVSGDVRIGGPLRWYGMSPVSQCTRCIHHIALTFMQQPRRTGVASAALLWGLGIGDGSAAMRQPPGKRRHRSCAPAGDGDVD